MESILRRLVEMEGIIRVIVGIKGLIRLVTSRSRPLILKEVSISKVQIPKNPFSNSKHLLL